MVAAVAVLAVGVYALTRQGSTRPPASPADVYTQLAQQLKGHLAPLVPAKTTTKKQAPTIQVPPQQGYSCEVASGTGCSLHPCVKYAQADDVVAAASAGGCNNTAKATPRAIPIVAP